MDKETIQVEVYGLEQRCASCVNLPSSKETASWLEAALQRKYGSQVAVVYVDLDSPENDRQQQFATKIVDEDLWYPVVIIQQDIVAEGNPKLKTIYESVEKLGAIAQD
ncbi:YuzD family protein [Risungbinella massiliensis]|uniref:YuzD family protein n=1 Tax=Risungbinella massiliensis TaxID=1329796 RepID=UPI0005CBBE79|nr:DUF1462 family protein [Risungbinella massiliensis]